MNTETPGAPTESQQPSNIELPPQQASNVAPPPQQASNIEPDAGSPQSDVAQDATTSSESPFASLRRLPEAVLKAPYVSRTRSLLARRRERVATVRAQTRQEILDVFKDIDRDVRQGVQRFEGSARKRADSAWQDFIKTTVGQRVEGLFGKKTKPES